MMSQLKIGARLVAPFWLNILLLSNARIDTDEVFFDSEGCTRTCSMVRGGLAGGI